MIDLPIKTSSATISLFGDVVKKSYPIEQSLRCQSECNKLARIRLIGRIKNEFSSPKILYCGKSFYEMELVRGSHLSLAVEWLDPSIVGSKILSILDSLRFHRHSGGDTWDFMMKKLSIAGVNDSLLKSCQSMDLPCGFSHGDLTFDNILVSPCGRFNLIDPVYNDAETPLWDAGKILQTTLIGWKMGSISIRSDAMINVHGFVIDGLLERFKPRHVCLGLACQLARVSRWACTDFMMEKCLTYMDLVLNGNDKDCIVALRG